MLEDIRITVRQLRKAPGHIAAVLVALATGLAVCIAAFSAVNALLFAEVVGVTHRQDLVQVRWGNDNSPLSRVEWDRAQPLVGNAFSNVAAEGTERVPVVLPTGPATLTTALVSGRYFETLGTRPVLGRLLDDTDAVDAGPSVVLLGARVWREHFGASPEALGKTITVAGAPAVVVGVTPDRMAGLALRDDAQEPQLWRPLRRTTAPLGAVSSQRWLSVAGRLRPGVALSTARAEMARIGGLLDDEYLAGGPRGGEPQRLRAFRAGFTWRDTPVDALAANALMLFVPIGVLAIGCLNVVNLQLSRAADRVRELRVRLALGASRARIVRLLATEIVLLFGAAATVGWRGAVTLLRLAEPYFGRPLEIAAPVLGFGLVLALLVIGVAGVAPAWLATRGLAQGQPRERGDDPVTLKRLRAGLVVAQVAASMALLFVSALGIASLRAQAPALPIGAGAVLVTEFALGDVQYSPAQAGVFVRGVLAALDQGQTSAGFSDVLPFTGAVRYALPADPAQSHRMAAGGFVTSGWFDALDLQFVAGRPFASGASDPVAVINQAAATAIGGRGGAALGRVVRAAHVDGALRDVQIVGVVADSPTLGGRAPVPMMFLPMPAAPPTELFLSTRAPQAAMVAAQIRTAVDAVDRSVPWVRMDTLASRQQSPLRIYRQVVSLGSALGALSLGLAATGLFALMSYTVRRRTHEFGVRLAIGATPGHLARMVLRQGSTLVACGVCGGFLIAIPLGYVLRSVLVGTSPVDPAAMSIVTAVFLTAGVVAAAAPARRAARVDPMVALREE